MLKLCKKYQPETKEAKKARLMEMAQQKKDLKRARALIYMHMYYMLLHVFSTLSKFLYVMCKSSTYLLV